MPPAEAEDDVDVGALHQALRALANPVRLQLLQSLRVPKRLADLRVQAPDQWGAFHRDRALSRSTVQEHVAVLEELGLVTRVPGQDAFVVDRQRMFRLVEDLGALARIRPVLELDVQHTMTRRGDARGPMPEGPKLILVSGPEVGDVFPLRGDGPWTIGRGAEADVRLGYDPHVSRVHVVVSRGDDGLHLVEALAGATNPAQLDFQELAPGEVRALIPGAVLTVGGSRFVFKGV